MEILQRMRRAIAGSWLDAGLRGSGLGGLVLAAYDRRVFATGTQDVTAFGYRMRFLARSKAELIRFGMFGHDEGAFVAGILKVLRRGDAFFDVGANIGAISNLVALRPNDLGDVVIGFEPHPEAARTADVNCGHKAAKVRMLVGALAEVEEEASLVVAEDNAEGTHSLGADAQNQARIPITFLRGDAVAVDLGLAPTVMKIDVEGAELSVLRGVSEILRRSLLREVFVGVHPSLLQLLVESEETVTAYMGAHGFTSAWYQKRGSEVHCRFVRAEGGAATDIGERPQPYGAGKSQVRHDETVTPRGSHVWEWSVPALERGLRKASGGHCAGLQVIDGFGIHSDLRRCGNLAVLVEKSE